ncbi:FimB/Mfa2 family fimbrial subunit [Bacteroides sp. 519]|uniref:FimB/Mfa2 family fimbrial subunit n=1 Tax=Bacteroides sp. 519 TaxID=2302937 RepID=UPI0013D12420|nr:FimB/Mfa2 family fimbrial subunit [Bacteroides sp. 519]NDV60587.1 DUF4906 domain-containing protein [Bacteroides sp. 519]
MKQKRSQQIKSILSLALLIPLLSACNQDENVQSQSNDQHEITLNLSMPANTGMETRATVAGTTEENTIKSLYLLVCDKTSGEMVTNAISCTVLTGAGTATQTSKATVPAGSYDLILIANASSQVGSLASGTAKTVITGLTYTKGTDKWDITGATNNTSIPMWGETKNVTISTGATVTIDMKRILARVNVKKSVTNDVFTFTKVLVYNYSRTARIVPPATDFAGVTYVADSYLEYNSYAADSPIYLFEAPSRGAYGAANWKQNTCLVVGGEYNKSGTVTYYRIDFKSGSTWYDLLRNNIYTIDIKSVTSAGYTDPDDAYKAVPTGMTINVLAWEDEKTINCDL